MINRRRSYRTERPVCGSCTHKDCTYFTDDINPLACAQHPQALLSNGMITMRGAPRTLGARRRLAEGQQYADKLRRRKERRR